MGIKTIGSGGDYATLAAWATYVNALSLTENEVGRVTGTVTDTTGVNIGGWTANGFTVTLEAAPGQSVSDGGRLWWLTSGRAILTNSVSTAYPYTLNSSSLLVRGLQIEGTNVDGFDTLLFRQGAVAESCIVRRVAGTGHAVGSQTGGGSFRKSLVIALQNGVRSTGDLLVVERCTVVGSQAGGVGIRVDNYSVGRYVGNAVLGFTSSTSGSASAGTTHNAYDIAPGGTGYGTSAQSGLSAADFVNTTSGSEDYRRAPSSTRLGNTGVAISGLTTDIFGTSLPQGGVNDIGAHEFSETGTGPTLTNATKSDTATTLTGGFTTTGTDGTARMVWVASATVPTTPSVANVKAGFNAAGNTTGVIKPADLTITSSGAKTFAAATGATTGLTYWGFVVHTNAASADSNVFQLGAAYPGTGRLVSDVTPGSFTASAGGVLAAMISENTADDATFITSPVLTSTPAKCVLALGKSYAAGTYGGVKFRMWTASGTGTARIRFVNDSGTVMGVTADQLITTTPTTYTLPVTLTGTATRVEIEQQA